MRKTRNTRITVWSFMVVLSITLHGYGQLDQGPGKTLGEGLMPIGVYYYPEHWEEADWEKDLSHLARLGFQFTHFGEFAWARMEPEEGQYDFEWLDKVVTLAGKYGLKVIMCTPTPTPPVWLTQKHPEILSVNENLIRQQHGSRQHILHNHPTYLNYVEKIVTKLAQRYGNNPHIAGWQIDNEPHFGPIYDYSQQAQKEFPGWLEEKYHHIDTLNKAWGTAFWSQTYNNFEQVQLPGRNWAPQGANPHALLDFHRFTADRLAEGLRFQANILRNIIAPDQWITTNYAYFKFLPASDPFRVRDDMDFASHTMYLTSGYLNDEGGTMAHRLGSGKELAFSAELAKSVNGLTGIMEIQPGQINWGAINPLPLPGAVRMWLWHSFALGDEFACAYRFRQPLFGSEQTHKGIIETDGHSLTRGGSEYVQTIEEMSQLPVQCMSSEEPKERKSRKTAFLWKPENLVDINNHRHHKDFDPWQFVYDYYAALKSMGSEVVFLQEHDDFDPEVYPFMVVPAFQIANKNLITQWENYVLNGGNLILTSRTAQKDQNGHLWKAMNQQPIWELVGAAISEFDHLPSENPGEILFNGDHYSWHRWGDVITPNEGTKVLAEYQDQFYKGKAAAVTRSLGKGNVTYIGTWSDDGSFEREILQHVYTQTKTKVLDLPPYVFVEWRDGFWVAVNYSSNPYELPLKGNENLIHGQKLLQPGAVTVWCEN